MAQVTKDTTFCEINIDTATGAILIQERWQYTWLTDRGQKNWTLPEKRDFHHRADAAIWNTWSNRARLVVTGQSDFAKRFHKKSLTIKFDIRWVTAHPHWHVNVTKIRKGIQKTSSTVFFKETMDLDSEDVTTKWICGGDPRWCRSQTGVAHEFGHSIGNIDLSKHGDEYHALSRYYLDRSSIMNAGHVVRKRHFDAILVQLNKMMDDTHFAVR